MTQSTDAIIIGAGVIGTAIALELNRSGIKTISIDKNRVAGYGSTSGSCAIIRVHYSTYDGIALAYEGYHYWRDWQDYLGLNDQHDIAEFRETGCLVMCTEQNGYLEKHTQLCDQLTIPYQTWDKAKIQDRLPLYNLNKFWPAKARDHEDFGKPTGGDIENAIFFPTAGYVTDPQLSAQNLRTAAENNGAKFLFNNQVTEIIKDTASGEEKVKGVRLANGETILSSIVVNVAGPESANVNAMAGVLDDMTIKTKALKQEVTHLPAPSGFDFYNQGFVISDSDISCYCRPEKGNFMLVGSEDPECDNREWVNPTDYDRNFTEQWTTQAYRYAQRVPSLGIPSNMKGVVDLYDVSDDWIPIYDKSSLQGYYMAIGSSGNQYKNAPIAGKMMTAMIQHNESGHNQDTDPVQFELPYIKKTINTGFYSRKRKINDESSFSVLG